MNALATVLLCFVLLAGCDVTSTSGAKEVAVTDSSGVTILTYDKRALATLTRWHLSEKPTTVIGSSDERVDDDERSRFFLISGLRKLPHDRILVATDASKQVFISTPPAKWSPSLVG